MRYVLIVDDQPLITNLIASSLAKNGCTVETASTALEAQAIIDEVELDVAIVDLHLGAGPSGFDVAHYIQDHQPETYILTLSGHSVPKYISGTKRTLPPGTGFLPKEDIDSPQTILNAIEEGLAKSNRTVPSLPSNGPLQALSAGQLEILRMLAQGFSPRVISNQRKTTLATTEQAITQIYKRLNISNRDMIHARTEAVRLYIKYAGVPSRHVDDR